MSYLHVFFTQQHLLLLNQWKTASCNSLQHQFTLYTFTDHLLSTAEDIKFIEHYVNSVLF